MTSTINAFPNKIRLAFESSTAKKNFAGSITDLKILMGTGSFLQDDQNIFKYFLTDINIDKIDSRVNIKMINTWSNILTTQ